jgi:hypothetical protein
MYDTNTAKLCGSWDNGCNGNDLDYCAEQLYRKKTGEFFLCGDGGARSIYSHTCDYNSRCGGSAIIPLTKSDANEWAASRLSAKKYQMIFGDID